MLLKANSKCTQNISKKNTRKKDGCFEKVFFVGNRFASTKRSFESPDWTTPVISFDEKYPVGKRMNASVYVWFAKAMYIFGCGPATVTTRNILCLVGNPDINLHLPPSDPGRGVRKPKVYRKKDDGN